MILILLFNEIKQVFWIVVAVCSWLEFEFGILTQSADGIFAQICVTFGSSAQSATGSFAQSAVWLETRTFQLIGKNIQINKLIGYINWHLQ